jgi:MoaA/NifB/PqqE/SkfB family radical SAM enzyme
MAARSVEDMLERERVANRRKHWVRAVTACNSRCLFCLDSDTPRNVYLPEEDVKAELRRGREELDADKVIISGGEASLHPLFPEFIRYAKSIGYDRVQTVTNGHKFADRDFYLKCRDAGLGEITFSLHGHTAELHDEITRAKSAFDQLMKGMVRAIRDRNGPIVNVDVVICKKNVAVLDKIVELAISVGVTEFDLLHVIPQAAAYEHRDELFYDVRDHMEVLHKVFRLNRHPRFCIWTNRFPVSYLEGLEDLIQDPHKMLDEVNGRRWQVRRYLDVGDALDCRQPERCVHCFIEPYCETQDRVIARTNTSSWQVWDLGDDVRQALPGERMQPGPLLPYGCTRLGVTLPDMPALRAFPVPENVGLYATIGTPGPLPGASEVPLTLVAPTAAHLDAWLLTDLPTNVDVVVHLTKSTAPWLLAHRDRLEALRDRVRIHQPSYEHLKDAREHDVQDPAAFFGALGVRMRVSGLPACTTPGMELAEPIAIVPNGLFEADTGRLSIKELAHFHVKEGYRSKSERCRDCALTSRCDGAHINLIRDQGLARLQPVSGAWKDDAGAQLTARMPTLPQRILHGRPLEKPHTSLPGFAQPTSAPPDPLAVVAKAQQARRAERVAKAKAEMAAAAEAPPPAEGK